MDFTEFGWREAWMLAVVVAAAYLGLSLIRLVLLRRRRQVTHRPASDTRAPSAPASEPAPAVETPIFAEHLAWTRLEAEMDELRADLAAMRTELAGARNELAGMQAEVAQLKAGRQVSPLYAEAVDLAQRGYDARGIAEECGISVAEAELVLSMSGNKNFDDEVDHGGSGPVEPSGR